MRSLTIAGTEKWNSRFWVSIAADIETKARETKEFKLILKAELDKVIRRKREHSHNIFKAYAEFQDRCNKALKVLIEARMNHKTNIHNNPITLLRAIKEHVLNY